MVISKTQIIRAIAMVTLVIFVITNCSLGYAFDDTSKLRQENVAQANGMNDIADELLGMPDRITNTAPGAEAGAVGDNGAVVANAMGKVIGMIKGGNITGAVDVFINIPVVHQKRYLDEAEKAFDNKVLWGQFIEEFTRVTLGNALDSLKTLLVLKEEAIQEVEAIPDKEREEKQKTQLMLDLYGQIEEADIFSRLVVLIKIAKDDKKQPLKKEIRDKITGIIREFNFNQNEGRDNCVKGELAFMALFPVMAGSQDESSPQLTIGAIMRAEGMLRRTARAKELTVAGNKIKIGMIHRPKNDVIYRSKNFIFGGDAFLIRVLGKNFLLLSLLDVSGHNFYATMIKTAIISWAEDAIKILNKEISENNEFEDMPQEQREKEINRLLGNAVVILDEKISSAIDESGGGGYSFATLELALIDYKNREMHYLSAGHVSLAYVNQGGMLNHEGENNSGLVLGLLGLLSPERIVYTRKLASEGIVYMYSDGAEKKLTIEDVNELVEQSDRTIPGIIQAIERGYEISGSSVDDYTVVAVESSAGSAGETNADAMAGPETARPDARLKDEIAVIISDETTATGANSIINDLVAYKGFDRNNIKAVIIPEGVSEGNLEAIDDFIEDIKAKGAALVVNNLSVEQQGLSFGLQLLSSIVMSAQEIYDIDKENLINRMQAVTVDGSA